MEENFNQQLRNRTMLFAVSVHDLFNNKKIGMLNRSMVIQILRSSSSVAANFRAAARARSDPEFLHKVCIVVEECDETQFWLEYLLRIGVLNESEIHAIRDEVDQLVRLFTSIKRKMKEKLEKM